MIVEAIQTVVAGGSLSRAQADRAMEEILTDHVTPAQFGALVTGLRVKGETDDEIAGLADAMRRHATSVDLGDMSVVDTCGTGGSGAGWFNVSTTAAFVAAGAGAKVAKHGNRGMTRASGSADVLEALGVKLDVAPRTVAASVAEAGVGFMFAQAYHPGMKFAAPLRREIGIRTVFNILGPLTNPAGVRRQLLGVADFALAPKMAGALGKLGAERVLVVHGDDGVDEISLAGPTQVADLDDGATRVYTITPDDLGLPPAHPNEFIGGSAEKNADITRSILAGVETGPKRDVVLANAAGALIAAGSARDWRPAVEMAAAAIDDGSAGRSLQRLIEVTNRPDPA